MRSLKNSVSVILVLASTSACAFEPIDGSGVMAQESRTVGSFSGIVIEDGLHATVTPGPLSVVVRAEDNVLPHVQTRIEHGRLVAELEDGYWYMHLQPVELHIQAPSLAFVEGSGGAHVTAQATAAARTEVVASGGSIVGVSGIDATTLVVDGSGGSELTLSGRSGSLDLGLSGGSDGAALGLATVSCAVDASGGSHAAVRATQSLRADLSGGSVLRVAGAPPERSVQVSGGSTVRYE